MGGIIRNIKETTKEMSRKEKMEYIVTYYWYHILGIVVVFSLIVFGIVHFAFPEKKPLFTCALVNQKIDSMRDGELEKKFADFSQSEEDRIRFDSDYIISYQNEEREESEEDSNQSGFDKFFFQWSGGDLDAVIMTEDFLSYCIEVGGKFHEARKFDTEGLNLVKVDGIQAVDLDGTKLEQFLNGTENRDLVLVFPETGKHTKSCQKFLDYLKQ